MSEKPVEGWYQSPDDAKMLRWWDGTQWTDNEKPHTTSTASAFRLRR